MSRVQAKSGWLSQYEWKTVLLFVASLVMSGASFYTTYYGMIEFMGVPLIAGAITFSVQALLFVISWWLARNWVMGVLPLFAGSCIFLLCASISVFFSFASLFSFIDQGRTKETTAQRAQTQVVRILNDLEKTLQEDLALRKDALIVPDDGLYQAWRSQLTQVQETALSAPEEYRAQQRTRRNRLTDKRSEIALQIGDAKDQVRIQETSAQNLESQAEALQRQIEREEAAIDRLRDQIAGLDSRTVDLEREMKRQAVTGKGAKYLAAETALKEVGADLEILEQTLIERSDALRKLRSQVGLTPTGSISSQRAELTKRIADLEQELFEIDEQIKRIDAGGSFDVAQQVGFIDQNLTLFETSLDFEAFAQVVAECKAMVETLKKFVEDGLPQGFQCDRQRLTNEVSQLQVRVDEIKEYRNGCTATSVVSEQADFGGIVKVGETCIAKSRLDSNLTEEASESLIQMRQTGGDQAHGFALAQASLMRDKSPLAIMALVIAIAIDSLVLLCALIGTSQLTPIGKDIEVFLGLSSRRTTAQDHDGRHKRPKSKRAGAASFDRVTKWLVAHDLAHWDDTVEDGAELVLAPGARNVLRSISNNTMDFNAARGGAAPERPNPTRPNIRRDVGESIHRRVRN